MNFEKQEINKFDGFNSNVAPELLKDEAGTGRDIMNFRSERIGKLVTRNGYRICPYGDYDMSTGATPDFHSDMLYRRNGGTIGIGEFSQSHKTSDNTDRYLVNYIRALSTLEAPYTDYSEDKDYWKFPQRDNTAPNSANREHLAGFIFSPIDDNESGTLLINNEVMKQGDTDVYQLPIQCDLNPQDGMNGAMKNLYAPLRNLSVSDASYTNNNLCHRVHDVTSHNTNEDSIDKRYVTMNQYRQKLIVSDKLNGDMAIENIWDSQTDLDEEDRTDGFRIRANCVEDFDINKVYLDARLRDNQENSISDGVETGMALYKFELDKQVMKVSTPLDTGTAVDPENYKVYQQTPVVLDNYPDDADAAKVFFGLAENVMLSNVNVGASTYSRVLNKTRFFSNAEANTEYSDLLGKLKLSEFEYYDDLEDQTVKRNIADTYVWEDMQIKYYPSKGVDQLSYYVNTDNRIADQSNANAQRLTNLEVQDGIGRKAPLGGWRYRFVWDYGNGDYSAPSTEVLCPDIMWSATKDDDVDKLLRQGFKDSMDTRAGYQAVSGSDWDEYKINGFTNLSVGYSLVTKDSSGDFILSEVGKTIYDIKSKLYEDIQGKYGVYGSSGYNKTTGVIEYTDPAIPWETYNVGDFACNIMLKSPAHSIGLRGIIAQFAMFDGKIHGNPIEYQIITKDSGFNGSVTNALFAMFKLEVPTFPYEGMTNEYGNFERFALMHGIFDYHGRYRLSYPDIHGVFNKFILMPNYLDMGDLTTSIATDNNNDYYNSGFKYGGILYNYKVNHSNKFYLTIEGGMPYKYDDKYGFTDIHNTNRYRTSSGVDVELFNQKPETLLRAYINDSDSPVIFNPDIPAEVSSRILVGGMAELEIVKLNEMFPLIPHKSGDVSWAIDEISIQDVLSKDDVVIGYNGETMVTDYGWNKTVSNNDRVIYNYLLYTADISIISGGNVIMPKSSITPYLNLPSYTSYIVLNSGMYIDNGLYSFTMTKTGEDVDNIYYTISDVVKLSTITDYNNVAGYSDSYFWYYSIVANVIEFSVFTYGKNMLLGSQNGTNVSFVFNIYSYDVKLESFIDNTTQPTNRTEVSVYLPGHRSTLLEQVVSIFPSSLLHKCPRVAIKIPEYNIPKKAKRLLIYRTLNSLSNEYDPLSYGLVKAFEIRRANKYDTGLVCEEDRADVVARPVNIGDVITSEYNYTDPDEFILDVNGVPTTTPVGTGGTDKDCYNGIYFFDDVRDTIVDFSNNPDQYEALRYALKSAYNIAIAERMFYGNVIQQYQPEAPMAFNNNRLVNKDNAINNVFYITGKANGSGLAPASQYVQYAYVFEDEMQIKSQVELTDIIQLKSNAIEILGWDGQGTQPVIADSEQRDIALYLVPGSYTNGIKRTIVYRKMWATSSGTPNTEAYVTGFYQVGEIDNKKDKEGIFVDDGLPNGTMLPIKQVNHNGEKWVFDTPPNSYEYESGVFWSEPYRPDVIKMENFMEFGSGDGGQITGLQSLYGNIVVFKNSSMYRSAVQAENPPISRVDLVSRYEGCIAPNTLLNVEDTMFFLSSGGFMQYDNNVIKAADDAFHDELMFLLKSNEMYNEEASAAYNQHFKEIYLNVPKLKPTVKWIDIVKDIIPDYAGTDFILGQYNCLVDTNDAQYYDTMEWQDIDSGHPEKIFERETYGHIFVINQHNGYNTKFGYPATSFRKLADNSSYFPIFAYHSLHLMRKYYTSERGVLYSGDVIPHWYGVNDGGGQGSMVVSGRCVDCDTYFRTITGNSTFPLPNDRRDNLLDYDTEQDITIACNFCQGIREITVNLDFEYTETPFKPPVFWAGLYSESPCTGDSALQYISTNNDYGQLNYVKNSYSEMDMFLNHRELYKLLVDNNFTSDSRPTKPVFPKIDSIEINNVFKSKFYTAETETVLKRLRSAGINMFAKGNIRVLYTQFPVESVDSGIRYTPLPEIFLSLNNNFMEHTVIQSRYNYPPTTDVYNKWLNTITVGSQENVLYFIPDTRMANNIYKGQTIPFNDDIGKPLKFSIEIYSQGRTQINALTYHIRHIWSYLR